MSASPTTKTQLQIHFCVLLWGFTPILGKMISLTALPLVWWRMLIVVAALAFVPRVWRGLRAMPLKLILAYCGIGVVVALHWLTFYGAIKLSNASVAVTCIALAPAFTSVIEPWLTRRPFSWRELAFGVAVLPGVALVVGGVPDGMRLGVAVGALSALLVAIFGSFNKRLVEHADPLTVTAVELGAGTVALTALAPLLVLWIGYGLVPVIVLCALIVFFPILVAGVVGLRMVPRDVVDAARSDGAGSFALLRHIEAPMALPALLGGFKNGFALSVTGAVVGEMVMGGSGLGTVLTVQRDAVDTTGMFATIAWLCVIAASAYSLITWWERRSAIVEALT